MIACNLDYKCSFCGTEEPVRDGNLFPCSKIKEKIRSFSSVKSILLSWFICLVAFIVLLLFFPSVILYGSISLLSLFPGGHCRARNASNLYTYLLDARNFSRGSLKTSLHVENMKLHKNFRSLRSSSFDLLNVRYCIPLNVEGCHLRPNHNIHTDHEIGITGQNAVEVQKGIGTEISSDANGAPKLERKRLKGKRAVVKWLKFFRWKKKKEYERMTSEEKILYKLRKTCKKEERLVEALQKIEPEDSSVTTHDPEVLTPEEHFYLLKLGQKCKNYVPVGRRGIFQGVILNMHLHWKKHQTLKVIVKTFTAEEVREIASELARLSGGIVLDIDEDNTIIMYRGKNYSQPPTEIMSPKVTLTRKKALDKSKYRDALHAVKRYIPKLEQELQNLHAEMKNDSDYKLKSIKREENPVAGNICRIFDLQVDNFEGSGERNTQICELDGNELERNMFNDTESAMYCEISEPQNLSDIFETDSDIAMEEKDESPLFLNEIERFPSEVHEEPEDFQEHLRHISAAAKRGELGEKDLNIAELDDIDKIFFRAESLLKKKR